MPIFRTPDGKIVEEKTRRGDTATESGGNEHPTHKIDPPGTPPASSGDKSREKSVDDFYDAPTVADKIPRPRSSFTPAAPVDDEETRIHGRATPNEESGAESEQIDAMQDPLSGWLVIVSGPGKGNAVKLGYGLNSIGRSEQDRVNLSFGDSEISRNKHATLIYDPKKENFICNKGMAGTLSTLMTNRFCNLLKYKAAATSNWETLCLNLSLFATKISTGWIRRKKIDAASPRPVRSSATIRFQKRSRG